MNLKFMQGSNILIEWEHEDIIADPQEQCREDTELLVGAVQQGVQP